METIHLEGAEDVRRASGQMREAADAMSRAASSAYETLHQLRTFGDDWLVQFTTELRNDQEHRTAWLKDFSSLLLTGTLVKRQGDADPIDGIREEACRTARRNAILAVVPKSRVFTCKARVGSVGANEPQDCDWPVCGCDEYASKVINAMEEAGGPLSKVVDKHDALVAQVAILQHKVDLVTAYDSDLIPSLERDNREAST